MLKDSTRSGDELEEVVEACSSKRLDGVLLDVHHRLAEVRDDYIVAAAADDAADGVLLPHHGHHHELDAVGEVAIAAFGRVEDCLLYTSPSPRDGLLSRMPSSA